MPADVRVSFAVVKDEVLPAIDKQTGKLKGSKRVLDEINGGYKVLERTAVAALKKTSDEQVKINRLTKGLDELVRRGIITQQRANEVIRRTREEIDGTAAARKKDAATIAGIVTGQERVFQKALAIRRELQRGNITLDAARRKMALLRAGTAATAVSTGQWATRAAGMLTSYVGVQQAISKIISLQTRQNELAREGAETNLGLAAGQRLALRNTEGESKESRLGFVSGLEKLADSIPFLSRAVVTAAGGRSISATSALEGENFEGRSSRVFEAIRSAAGILPADEPEQLDKLTQAILGFQKVSEGLFKTPEQATQQLLTTIGQSRLVETENIRNFIPALQSLRVEVERDGSKLSAADLTAGQAFLAQLSSGIEDPTGELTRTAGLQFFKTINEELPKSIIGFAEEIKFLRSEKGIPFRERVREKLKGRGVAKGSIEQIFSNIGFGANFGEVERIIGASREKGFETDELVRNATPELRAAYATAVANASSEDRLAQQFGGGGAILNQFDALNKPGGAVQEMVSNFGFFVQRSMFGNEEAFKRALEGSLATAQARDDPLLRQQLQVQLDLLNENSAITAANTAANTNQQNAQPVETGR